MPRFLVRQRWFGAKGRKISTVSIADTIRIPGAERDGFKGLVTLVDVTFTEGEPATYALPLAGRRDGDDIGPEYVIARVETPDGEWLLVDGLRDAALAERAPRDDRAQAGGARPAPPSRRHTGRGVRAAPRRGRARAAVQLGRSEQHVGDLRRPARAEAVPPPRGGHQPRARGGPVPDRSHRLPALRADRRRDRASRRQEEARRSRSSRDTCRTRATRGRTRSTRSRSRSSGRSPFRRISRSPAWSTP